MSDIPTTLFQDYDLGRISRRQLLTALGIAVAARPLSVFAQGQCGGARAGTPGCETTPAKPPFEPTGWKTVLLDHFSVQVGDYEKEAAYYAALMNWKIRSNDGKQAILDIGDWGGLVIRGGYQPPVQPATPASPNVAAPVVPTNPAVAPTAPPAAPANPAAAGGRGGGGGGRTPRMAAFDSYCWGIEPWDAKKVEAELRKRGLSPVADNDGKGFESFHVKDADGFALQISNGNAKNRRRGAANGKVAAAAPFAATNWKTVWLDHISFETSNYKEQVAFYSALLGWTPGADEGSQSECQIGNIGGIIIRRGGGGGGRGAGAGAAPAPVVRRASIGHISFGIAGFDTDAVKAELDKRGLNARVDMGGAPNTIEAMRTAKYQSFHTTTPNGFDLQISNVTTA